MFRYGVMSFLLGVAAVVSTTGSADHARTSAGRCMVPLELAHGGIDLAFCEDLVVSATLKPEVHIAVLRRVARVHAERANTEAARNFLMDAMSFDPLDRSVFREFAGIAEQHGRFVASFAPAEQVPETQVAGLSAND